MAERDEALIWDRFARTYDRVVRVIGGGAYRRMIERIKEDVAGATGRALEVAAGTGLITVEIAPLVSHLEATDLSTEMIARLVAKIDGRLEHVRASVQSAYQLAYEDHAFDLVVCANALHVIPEPDRAIREIRRVLKPGGRLIAPTFCHGQSPVARMISRLLGLTRFRAYTRFSQVTLEAWLGERGFDIGRSENLGGALPIVYVRASARS